MNDPGAAGGPTHDPPGRRSARRADRRFWSRDERRRHDESMLRGGLPGVALVTAATVGLAAAGALIALVVALLY